MICERGKSFIGLGNFRVTIGFGESNGLAGLESSPAVECRRLLA